MAPTTPRHDRPGTLILGVLHHGVTVSDIDVAVAWYRDVLGLQLIHRQRQQNAYTPLLVGVPGAVLEVAQMKIPSPLGQLSTHDIEIIQYVEGGIDGDVVAVNQVGTAHLAFLVADIESLVSRARAHGATFPHGPTRITAGANEGGYGCYFRDPDGNSLEFIQPAPSRMQTFLSILHR